MGEIEVDDSVFAALAALILVSGVIIGTVIGIKLNKSHSDNLFCRYKYHTLADYDKCLMNPDYRR